MKQNLESGYKVCKRRITKCITTIFCKVCNSRYSRRYWRKSKQWHWQPIQIGYLFAFFLNTQSNDYCSGEDILILGNFDFGDLKYLIENNALTNEEKINAYRHAVNTIDEEVETIIKTIVKAGKIPIVIGGGHNNAYPLIKAVSKALHKNGQVQLPQINAINLDAHSDYRSMEGRHSGNAFRYAENDGYLGKYSIVGLHENYISQNVLVDLHDNPFIQYTSYEDIF